MKDPSFISDLPNVEMGSGKEEWANLDMGLRFRGIGDLGKKGSKG